MIQTPTENLVPCYENLKAMQWYPVARDFFLFDTLAHDAGIIRIGYHDGG